MAIIYQPSGLAKGVRSEFLRAQAMAPPNLTGVLASVLTSTAASETYAWMGEAPQMQEIKDEIDFFSMTDTDYSIPNVEYGSGLQIKTKDLMNDQSGGVAMRIQQLANVAMGHPNSRLMYLLTNGTTGTGYDGVEFFSSTHTARKSSGTIDNLLAVTGQTTANVQTDIAKVFTYFGTVLAENGEPYHSNGVTKVAICAPWALRKPMMEAATATLISSTDNVQVRGLSIDLVFDARLDASSATAWYALSTGAPLRPLVVQSREGLRFETLTTGDDAFSKNVQKYKAQVYYGFGYGPFQAACKLA